MRDQLEDAALAAGDEVGGEFKIANAANDLREAARDCEARPGCSVEPILDLTDRLLELQSTTIRQQAYRLDAAESEIAPEVEREPGTSPFLATMPDPGRTVSLLKGTDLRDLITLNAPVKAALHDWLTWMRPMFLDARENYRYLRAKVAPVYEEAGLPEALLFAMMATESGAKVHSFSRAGGRAAAVHAGHGAQTRHRYHPNRNCASNTSASSIRRRR